MIASLKKNKKGILLMLYSSLCVCLGQLFWKLSSTSNIYFLILGFILYGMGALVMLYAYRFGELSILQPILSANYIFSLILGYLVLKEILTVKKIVGIFVIMLGVIFIGGGSSD